MEISTNRQVIPDEAWDHDDHKTQCQLMDGDRVLLVRQTRGDGGRGYANIPAGVEGVVIHARTPRVHGPGVWFANVDVICESALFRVRVPHNALRRVREVCHG